MKFRQITPGLIQKTANGEAAWKSIGDTFQLDLPKSRVDLSFKSPDAEPDFLSLSLFNKENGKKAGEWIVYEGDESWDLILNLYSLVHKRVTGWDKVFQDVESFISGIYK
jgi:hypothetical protein